MNTATKTNQEAMGRTVALSKVKALLSTSNIESQPIGTILNWYELDDNNEQVYQSLYKSNDHLIKHTALTESGDELVAEYECLEYALISTGIRLCAPDSVQAFIDTFAKPYEQKQAKKEPQSDFEAITTLATYAEELRKALSATSQMLEALDPYFYQTTLGRQIKILSLKEKPALVETNAIDSVNRDSIVRSSEIYKAARALSLGCDSKTKLVDDVIHAVTQFDAN